MSWFRSLFSRSAQPTARPAKTAKAAAVELGRNDPCWCGSGKKYKKCHLAKDEFDQREARYAQLTAKNAKAQSGDGITTRSKGKADARPPENEAASRAAGARR